MNFPFAMEALQHMFSKPSTENFPKMKKEAPSNYRGRLVFHPDRCNGCGMCIRVCAPAAITKTVKKTEEGDLITMEFHMGSCTFCQTCADFCNHNSIEMSQDYAMVARDEDEFKITGSFLKKPPPPKAPPKTEDSSQSTENS